MKAQRLRIGKKFVSLYWLEFYIDYLARRCFTSVRKARSALRATHIFFPQSA